MSATFVGMFVFNLTIAEKDKRFLKSTFGNYISPELIDQMYDDKQEPKLGGESGYHTAWFSDIQSFSSFSEVLEPEKMVRLMNEYLTEMTDILLKQKGTLDKYIGDSIVAFWGAPISVDDHEYLACMAALEMEEKLVELRVKWKSEDEWPEIVHHMQHRVGLSSGELVTGNMGSTMRMNYTMMGDMVNLGSRLESSAKQYGVYIQVEENLYEKVKDQFEWRTLDYVRVKGRTKPVHTYELLSEKGKLNETYNELLPLFQAGVDHYLKQEWKKAQKCFEASEKMEDMFPTRPTNPSRVYIERCKYFIENSPGKDWNGVWTLAKK
jgi:adenylate cyclase